MKRFLVRHLSPGVLSKLGTVALLVWAIWWGLESTDITLLSLAFTVLVCWGCAGLAVVASALALKRAFARAVHPQFMEFKTEQRNSSGLRLRFPHWIPLVQFGWTLNEMPATFRKHGRDLVEEALFGRRRLQDSIHRKVLVTDILGMFSWSFQLEHQGRLRVLPGVDSNSTTTPLVGMVAGSDTPDPYSAETGERLDMRRYRKGDPLHLVLWSIYQRSGHVMVRAPERALSQHQKIGLYLLSGSQDQPAASLCRVLLEQKALGPGWRFGADGSDRWAEDLPASLNLLAASGNPEKEIEIIPFLSDLARDSFGKCLILLSHEPETRNRGLAEVTQAIDLPRIGLDIWVVCRHDNIPQRSSFPRLIGGRLTFVEWKNQSFRILQAP